MPGFLLPELRPGLSLLDCGCGPGVITVGLARIVSPGEVHGVDLFDEQFTDAKRRAEDEGVATTFRRASVYELPFEDDDFDVVFANALLEHLAEPVAALREMRRVWSWQPRANLSRRLGALRRIGRPKHSPSESESSIRGSIPTAHWSTCKFLRQKSPDLRGFCRAL
jgi:SAM-dependent methyltransferase